MSRLVGAEERALWAMVYTATVRAGHPADAATVADHAVAQMRLRTQ